MSSSRALASTRNAYVFGESSARQCGARRPPPPPHRSSPLTASASVSHPSRAAEDTAEEDLDKIKGICGDVFESSPTGGNLYGELARRIRALLDKETGARGWNVVVGRSFGAFLTQKIKCYAYLSVFPGVNILVWRS